MTDLRRRRHFSLAWRVALTACVAVGGAVALAQAVGPWIALAIAAPLTIYAVHRAFAPELAMFRALTGTVTSYRDGDFAFSLSWDRDDELGELVDAHNALGDTLRQQRVGLVQRELLLDTMVQHTPVAMLLLDPTERVVYANLAARKLLGGGRKLEGQAMGAILDAGPQALREAVARGGDGLFAVERDGAAGDDEIYYLLRSHFRLNGRPHELFVLRHLTAELHRQEVQTWKKVIRVISHELNNSLAPIASLAHSGAELAARGRIADLDRVFETIADRARHLEGFIQGYARFAKLPAPRPEPTPWPEFVARLRLQVAFEVDGPLPDTPARFDRAQLEQALVNLLRNAHEAGSPAAEIRLRVRRAGGGGVSIEIADRGAGMSEVVLANALLPFYSTKRGGTGLGLALVREIAEAHGGRIAIASREGGGVVVTMVLP